MENEKTYEQMIHTFGTKKPDISVYIIVWGNGPDYEWSASTPFGEGSGDDRKTGIGVKRGMSPETQEDNPIGCVTEGTPTGESSERRLPRVVPSGSPVSSNKPTAVLLNHGSFIKSHVHR